MVVGEVRSDSVPAESYKAAPTAASSGVEQRQLSLREETASQLYAQFFDDQVGEGQTLDPIFRGMTYMRGIKKQRARALVALSKNPQYVGGKIPVKVLWTFLCEGMKSRDKAVTEMSDEALCDFFGVENVNEGVTLDEALDAATHARFMFAYRPGEYNFTSYRNGDTFVKYPPGFDRAMKNNPRFSTYLDNLENSLLYLGMEEVLNQQGKKAEEEARRLILSYLWNSFLDYCDTKGVDLEDYNMEDAVVGGRIAELAVRHDKGELGGEEEFTAHFAFLERLSEAKIGELIRQRSPGQSVAGPVTTPIGVSLDPSLIPGNPFYGIDFGYEVVWQAFVDEFFGGRTDLSDKEMAERISLMKASDVSAKLAKLREISKRETSKVSAAPK